MHTIIDHKDIIFSSSPMLVCDGAFGMHDPACSLLSSDFSNWYEMYGAHIM
eukprot:m.1639409 g.1639409  ORF g.1639409 m.1639409 type:complete len:51 (-) comp35179_c0_seq1:460-612(-)